MSFKFNTLKYGVLVLNSSKQNNLAKQILINLQPGAFDLVNMPFVKTCTRFIQNNWKNAPSQRSGENK